MENDSVFYEYCPHCGEGVPVKSISQGDRTSFQCARCGHEIDVIFDDNDDDEE